MLLSNENKEPSNNKNAPKENNKRKKHRNQWKLALKKKTFLKVFVFKSCYADWNLSNIRHWYSNGKSLMLGDMNRTYSVEVKPFPQQFCLSTEIGNCTLVFSAKFNFSSRVRHWIVLKSLCQESLNMAKLMLHFQEPAVFKASEFWTLIASVYALTLMSCVTMQGCSGIQKSRKPTLIA